ncbi:uncharacterized protein LOC111270865 isoform X2 [Varroa jacobsoni]|uniref:uncharacterized protein LOC111270865 isoform X2 n=1 Tax=Varroa jacobsoni TaxID=62625 RepID=UPI000BF3FCB5|nr:uncharacterized protein LOC111270865 isoform X2 [Varroa jacobsoni]
MKTCSNAHRRFWIKSEHPVDMAQPTFVELYSIPAFRNLNEKQIGNADSFVDNILSDITSDDDIVALLEPFTLPDVQFDLGSIQNVTVVGIASLRRTGGAIMNFDGKKLLIDLKLGVDDVRARAVYAMKLGVRLKGQIQVLVKQLSLNMRLTMTGSMFVLEKFAVENLVMTLTDFTGTSALNVINRWFINRFVKRFGEILRLQLEAVARKTIDSMVSHLDLRRVVAKSLMNLTDKTNNAVSNGRNKVHQIKEDSHASARMGDY